jgi:type IV pilus assembly protein PilN
VALVVEVVGLAVWYNAEQNQLTTVQKHNSEIQASIDDIKRQIANHPDILAQLKELREREDAISKLQGARTGPTSVLLELSHVLTPGRGPTVDRDKLEQLKRDNPGAVPNPNWDARRLWLLNYQEQDRTMKLAGLARDGEDVSEFLRRLSLSDFFYDVKLLPASKTIDGQTKLELVRFELSAKVRY